MLRYTGYVAAAPTWGDGPGRRSERDTGESAGDGAGEVLVAAGGGPVGDALFDAACGAARLIRDLRWRLLVGGSGAARAARIARLAALAAGTPTIVEPVRPDYRRMLARCAVSVSQIGYNTAVDLLQAGCPAVLAPFEEGGETEQRQRAEAFAERFGMAALPPGDPTPEALARAVEQARKGGPRLADPTRGSAPVDLDGARRSVAIAAAAVERRRKRDG
jgi:predicted glycosyltransferase